MIDEDMRRSIEKRLKDIALEDGTLSEDEQRLILSIIVNLERYSNMLEQAKEGGVISSNKEKQLFEGRMKILENAYDTARKNNAISEDEMVLLKEICKIVRTLD